eukprot:2926643-Lingulodinium_polyedra.AAC.1
MEGEYAYVLVYVDDSMVMGSDHGALFDLIAQRVLLKRAGGFNLGVTLPFLGPRLRHIESGGETLAAEPYVE